MKLIVTVKKECKYNGTSYENVELDETDIRELAEEKVSASYHSDGVVYRGQEIEITCAV